MFDQILPQFGFDAPGSACEEEPPAHTTQGDEQGREDHGANDTEDETPIRVSRCEVVDGCLEPLGYEELSCVGDQQADDASEVKVGPALQVWEERGECSYHDGTNIMKNACWDSVLP